jgi:hypothetical protein
MTILRLIILIMALTSVANCQSFSPLATAGPFHIEKVFSQRVQVDYAMTLSSPETKDGVLKEYALIPPETEMQKPVSCHVLCREVPNLTAYLLRDENDSTRFYQMIQVPLANGLLNRPIHLDIIYTVDLFKVKLREGADSSDISAGKPTVFDIRPTKCIDYTNVTFRSYLRDFDLIRTNGENNLAFAYRAYQILCADLAARIKDGDTGSPSNWRASYLCQRSMQHGACGNCAIQLVAILRANGVPARLLTGRWAKDSEPDYGQFHVRADFYDPSIGWIPVDPTFGFSDLRDHKNINGEFGNNNADFIIMHLNTEVHPQNSYFEMPLHQFGVSRYEGSNPFNPQWAENWIVKKIM